MAVFDHVQGISTFVYHVDGKLMYRTDTNIIFPVPVDELEGTHVGACEKSIVLMKWIRKYLEEIDKNANITG